MDFLKEKTGQSIAFTLNTTPHTCGVSAIQRSGCHVFFYKKGNPVSFSPINSPIDNEEYDKG